MYTIASDYHILSGTHQSYAVELQRLSTDAFLSWLTTTPLSFKHFCYSLIHILLGFIAMVILYGMPETQTYINREKLKTMWHTMYGINSLKYDDAM